MTVPSTVTRTTYAGDGASVAFSVPFYFLTNADLVVLLVDADGNSTTQVLTANYTLAGAGVEAGGTVTMLAAPPSGYTLVIYRDPVVTQLTDYAPNDPFPAESHERALDRLTMIAQRTKELLTRAFRLADSDTSGADTTLPSPQASNVIGWNEDADALQNFTPQTFATIVAFGTAASDVFNGDGVTTQFTLSGNPGALNNLDISIGGVTQTPTVDYLWSGGTTLTFTSAPPSGTGNILVRYMQGLPSSVTTADAVTLSDGASGTLWTHVAGFVAYLLSSAGASIVGFIQSGTGAVATTLTARLRKVVYVSDFGTLAQAIAYAKSAGKRVILTEDTVINVPADALTLQDAFDYTFTENNQVDVDVTLAAGYVFTSGLTLTNGDYSNYTITKVSGTFTVNPAFTGDIFYFDHVRAPVVDISIDATGAPGLTRGFCYVNTSTGLILPAAGVQNVTATTPADSTGDGLFLENCSTVNASNAVFTGCNLRNAHITTGSCCELSGANLSGGKGDWNVWCSRGSRVVLDGANLSGNTVGGGLAVLRSRVSMVPFSTADLNCSGNATINISVTDNGMLFAGNRSGRKVLANGAGNTNVSVEGGSTADVEGALLSNAGTLYGILCNEGSTVNARSATITGCVRAILCTNTSRVEAESSDCGLATTRGIECRRGSVVNATSANARMVAGVDGANDVVISAGGLVSFSSGIGGVNTPVNALTSAGIIFR